MSQTDEISRLIQMSKNTLAGSSKLVAKLMEGNERKEQLKEFEKVMGDLCILSEGHKHVCTTLEEVKKESKRSSRHGQDENANVDDIEGASENCDNVDIEGESENLTSLYKSKLAKLQGGTINVAEHPDMMAFKTMLREVLADDLGADDDEDVVLTSTEVNIHDPFTRRVMVDPVKNVKCGHNYERETIEEMMQKASVKCPYMSCPNKTVVRLFDLEPDEKLRQYIENQKATATDSTEEDVDDCDDSVL